MNKLGGIFLGFGGGFHYPLDKSRLDTLRVAMQPDVSGWETIVRKGPFLWWVRGQEGG